jgi:hypothetical protein
VKIHVDVAATDIYSNIVMKYAKATSISSEAIETK